MMLETIDKGRGSDAHPTPLLFIHGGWHAAWCWDTNFLDFFAGRGFRAVGLSLRGHGRSNTPKPLRSCSIGDYVNDVRSAVENLDREAVLIGHSMGGFVVQKYLEKHCAPAAILMASIPPQGIRRAAVRLVGRHPWVTLRAITVGSSADFVKTTQLAREALFCTHTPEHIVESCALQLQPESVYATAVGMNFPSNPRRVTTRLLVVGAEDDRMVTPAEVRATARAYHTRAELFPAMGHDMMLEPGWLQVAERIDKWLCSRGL